MSRADQGYRKTRASSGGGGGGGRGRSIYTAIREWTPERTADFYIREKMSGILDVLGIEETSDLAVQIEKDMREELASDKQSKKGMADAWVQDKGQNRRNNQALLGNEHTIQRAEAAKLLINALQSATKVRERIYLDEGDDIDDPASLLIDGSGWSEETVSAIQFRKHVNICIDNSGSTHMPSTGFCSLALVSLAKLLMEVLSEAAMQFHGVTWDVHSFNKVTETHTGSYARRRREELVHQQLENIEVDDPLQANAIETNLAPLMERCLEVERSRDLIGSPRLDIILTDGDFESQEDSDKAADFQRLRGIGVNTYVFNLCPEEQSEVSLPQNFRMIPVDCIYEENGRKQVSEQALRNAIMQVVLGETGK